MASANTMFKTHEEFRRAKELEEARKAGIAPAAVDEEGKAINPHIPQYMSSAPWYLDTSQPSLKHQKNWKTGAQDSERYYDRGVKTFQAKKWRKGACQNCGAITHETKDCLERPRAKGAKWTNKHIAADELVEDIQLSTFDAKRDTWNGYDPSSYAAVVDRHEKVEALKQEERKKNALKKRFKQDGDGEKSEDSEGSEGSEDEDFKIAEQEDAGFGKLEKRVRTTGGGASGSVRNLRIREDTAKYLLNLDPSSAHYDPKSRSMREDPTPNKDPKEKTFAGDNFVRQSGDFHQWQSLNLHSIVAHEAGSGLHMQAVPSQAEAMFHQFKQRKAKVESKTKQSVLEAYGNAAETPAEPELLLGQTERYLEYDKAGRVIKGVEVKAASRYDEGVLLGNHTAVWGSYWRGHNWGYACCHSLVKSAYCLGEAGRAAHDKEAEDADRRALGIDDGAAAAGPPEPAADTLLLEAPKPRSRAAWGADVDAELELDPEKLAAALKKAKKAARGDVDEEENEKDGRKRKYMSNDARDELLTEEEMEAYRITKQRDEDPLEQIKKAKAAAEGGYDFV